MTSYFNAASQQPPVVQGARGDDSLLVLGGLSARKEDRESSAIGVNTGDRGTGAVLPPLRPGHSPQRGGGPSRIAVMLPFSPYRDAKNAKAAEPGDFEDELAASQVTPRLGKPTDSGRKPRSPISVPTPAKFPAETAQETKRRGRPRASRKGPTSAWTARGSVVTPRPVRQAQSVRGSTGVRRRGRRPRLPSPPPRVLYEKLTPKFVAFLCEWSGCQAELHNTDTLSRHVALVHARGSPTCRWGRCAQAERAFATRDELLSHIEEAHMEPFRWHTGDGPQNLSGAPRPQPDEKPAFLLDREGNQVTPSVEDQKIEDRQTYLRNRRKLRELLIMIDENLPSEAEDVQVPVV